MKKFKFTLASYLRATEIKKDQLKKKLSKLFDELRDVNQLINSIETEIEFTKDYEANSLFNGANTLELNQIRYYMKEIYDNLKNYNLKREEIQQKINQCQDEMSAVMGEIKGLEKIREKQYFEYLHKERKETEIIIEEFLNSDTKNKNKKLQIS